MYSLVDLNLSKALFSLDPYNLQLHCFLGLIMRALFCFSFFYSLEQPCKALQTVQVAPRSPKEPAGSINEPAKVFLAKSRERYDTGV